MFIILAVNPAPTQTAEGSLHHPPPRQQLKPSIPGRSADDFNHIPPVLRDPSVQGVIVVLGFRPQLPQAQETIFASTGRGPSVPLPHHPRPHCSRQWLAARPMVSTRDMMLPTSEPLGTVVTMLATPFGRLDGLAIDTAGNGGWLATGSPPASTSEGVIRWPSKFRLVSTPQSSPRRSSMGENDGATLFQIQAIAIAVEDRINHGPASRSCLGDPPLRAGVSRCFRSAHCWLDRSLGYGYGFIPFLRARPPFGTDSETHAERTVVLCSAKVGGPRRAQSVPEFASTRKHGVRFAQPGDIPF